MNDLIDNQTMQTLAGSPSTDDQVVRLFLHGRAAGTVRAYRADVTAFLSRVGTLQAVTLGAVQDWSDSLERFSTATRMRRLASVKSLLSFSHRIGYVRFNVGAAVPLPKIKQTLPERLMTEESVLRMLALEQHPRNRVLLRLLYLAGLRVSEASGLRVRDLLERGDAGQINVHGKGGRTRVVLLPRSIWIALEPLTAGRTLDAPVFLSRKANALDPRQMNRIVKQAAVRAGLSSAVSPHFLRHAHVSHALDRGCPAHLVQATVGHASLATTSRYAHARPGDSSARYLVG